MVGGTPFIAAVTRHCGREVSTRRSIDVLCAERDSCFRTSMLVLQCRECSTTFYLNKAVVTDVFAGETWRHHIFYPFSSGRHPTHISNKRGSVVMATDLVHDFAIQQSTSRCVLHQHQTRLTHRKMAT